MQAFRARLLVRSLPDKVKLEPIACQASRLGQGAWFLEKMRGPGNQRQLRRSPHLAFCSLVERDDRRIVGPDYEQGWCLHELERVASEIWSASATHHGLHEVRTSGRGLQRRRGTGAGAKEPNRQILGDRLLR